METYIQYSKTQLNTAIDFLLINNKIFKTRNKKDIKDQIISCMKELVLSGQEFIQLFGFRLDINYSIQEDIDNPHNIVNIEIAVDPSLLVDEDEGIEEIIFSHENIKGDI